MILKKFWIKLTRQKIKLTKILSKNVKYPKKLFYNTVDLSLKKDKNIKFNIHNVELCFKNTFKFF